jgi:hypothetical protein
MLIHMTVNFLLCLFAAMLWPLVIQRAFTGRLLIINENKVPVWFRLIPQTGHHLTKPKMKKISQRTVKEIIVTADMIENKAIYSIEGEKRFGGDTCLNLRIDKDYQITFHKDKIGMTCFAEEIKR